MRGDDGAALVEFALVAPLLFMLFFGIIEFGSTYSQLLNLRHGAREGSRLAAVNYNPNGQSGQALANTVSAEICEKMDLATGATVALSVDTSGTYPDPTVAGRFVTVNVSAPVKQLTGFFGQVLDNVTLDSTVESRIEQQIRWTDASTSFAAPTAYTCP
jgi:Flp pilus assembly protein TadG